MTYVSSLMNANQEFCFEASTRMQERAHALIPGGAHTYAKGDDQYPCWPPAFWRGGMAVMYGMSTIMNSSNTVGIARRTLATATACCRGGLQADVAREQFYSTSHDRT